MITLKESLARIVSVRERWIAINDDTVAPSLVKSIRRLLPIPGLFEAIPFRKTSEDLGQLVRELEEEIMKLETFRRSEFADPYSRTVAAAAIPYAQAIATVASILRESKKQMADSLDNLGPKYSWGEYKRDIGRYESLRPEVAKQGAKLSRVINGVTEPIESLAAPRDDKRPEVPIENAVSGFLNEVRRHVEASWANRAAELPEILPSADAALVRFAKGETSMILMIHAMFAVELRESRRVYPNLLASQLETLALGTVRANTGVAGSQFAAVTEKFLQDYDDAETNNFDPLIGIGLAMSHFIQINTSQTFPADIHLELSKAMFAVATSLKQEWWANFARRMKLDVGA